MFRLPPTGLTLPAVVGRGLSEGLGRTRAPRRWHAACVNATVNPASGAAAGAMARMSRGVCRAPMDWLDASKANRIWRWRRRCFLLKRRSMLLAAQELSSVWHGATREALLTLNMNFVLISAGVSRSRQTSEAEVFR